MKVKKYKEFKESYSEGLESFKLKNIYSNKRSRYSSTFGLYDLMPKYFHGDVEKIRYNKKYVDIIVREFEYRGEKIELEITPAKLLLPNGVSKDFLPTNREEIIEHVIRKIANNPTRGKLLNNKLGVCFTLYDLWAELRRIGHPYDYSEIKQSLLVMSKTNITATSVSKKVSFSSNIFETFGVVNENVEDKMEKVLDKNSDNYNKKITYFVRFNSLVSLGIEEKTWRILNYNQFMSYKKAVSRWLHKIISNMFLVNRIEIPFNILLSTIIRNSGMTQYEHLKDNAKQVKSCLEEMIRIGSIKEYRAVNIYSEEKRNKLKDVKFYIYASDSFFEDSKLNNYIYDEDEENDDDFLNDDKFNEVNIKQDKSNIILDVKKQTQKDVKMKENTQKIDNLKRDIKSLLESVNIQETDIKDLLRANSEDELEKLKTHIQAGVNYINKQKNNCCMCRSNKAIIKSSIFKKWRVNKCDSTVSKISGINESEINTEQEIRSILSGIKNKYFKKIVKKIIENFGLQAYKYYLNFMKFISMKDNILDISISNGYAFDIISREYLYGIQRTLKTGEKVWYKKGIKELIKEVFPKICMANFTINSAACASESLQIVY